MMISPNFSQLEESEAKCAEAQKSQQTAALELENLHTELETLSRNKTLVRSWRGSGTGEVGGQQCSPTSLCLTAIISFFTKSALISVFTKSPNIFTKSLNVFSKSPSLFGNNSPQVV